MAAFDFPSSPNVNDIYTLNGVAFMWNGSVWKRYSTSTGAQGFQGAAGAAGAQGAQGTAGVLGGDGAQGAVGAQGATGSGATGAQGAAGADGAQGAAGAAGAQGAPFDRSEYNYTASGGQTAFAAAYANASDVDVFMNGVRLTPAEYTPSGGTTITLASGATAGDIIDILTFASAGPTGAQGSQGHQGDAFNRSESNFTATSGQTSFAPSGGYTNGDDLDVFVNGVRLTPADYTATNGTNVVLDVGANTGDIVDIIYYEAAGPAGAQGATGAAGIAGTITFSTSAPSNPIMGDLWYDTDDGAFAGYYNDGNTSQWIDLSGGPRGAQGADGAQGAAGSIPSNITAVNGTFSGNVSIAGTLTYEDVTNIDAVGVITARAGIDVTGGRVGIGTDFPDASLHIHRDDAASYPAIWMSGSTKRKNVIKVNNSDNLIISVDEDDEGNDSNFRLQIDGSEKLRVIADGSIGIGTNNPLNGVDIVQSEGRLRVNRFSHLLMQNTNDSTTDYWAISARNGGELDIGYGTPDGNSLVTGDKLTITSAGQMGLGTVDPNSYGGSVKLAVANTSGTCGLSIVSATNGDGNLYYADGTSGDATYRGYIRYNHTLDQLRFGTAGAERMRLHSGGTLSVPTGIEFGSGLDGTSANTLDDYEEGTLSWRLQRDNNIGAGNNVNTRVTYTKIGNRVYISGYIYTANTGSTTSNVNIIIRSDSNTANVATLPYLPNHSGGLTVTGTRTISDNYRNMAVTFQENSSTVYLYRDDGDNNYVKNTNNVSVAQNQTHLVLQFCGSYTTNS